MIPIIYINFNQNETFAIYFMSIIPQEEKVLGQQTVEQAG